MLRFSEFMINENKKVRDIQKIFSDDSGYDTPKKLNRSDQIVPKETLEKIENGITIEDLEEIDLPVFKYRTQITIHGIFDELTKFRIGGYKNIFQNKNKSIGVKWNAIDYEKKKEIYSVLKTIGYSIRRTSDVYYATKMKSYSKENLEKMKEEYDNIKDDLFIGHKELYAGTIPMLGTFIFLDIKINAIYEENIWKFINQSFDIQKEKFLEEKRLKEEESEREMSQLRKKWDEEDLKRKEEFETEWNETIENLKKVENIESLPEECILLTKVRNQKYIIKKYERKGEPVFQMMPYNEKELEKINKRLRKYNREKESIKKLIETGNVYLLKSLKEDSSKLKRFKDFSKDDPDSKDFEIIDYSDKAVAVIGNTYEIKDKLKELGGRFNKFLTHPETGKRVPGWIFSKRKENELREL